MTDTQPTSGHDIAKDQFADARAYIDACLDPQSAPAHLLRNLTTDASQLLLIIDRLEQSFPTPPALPEFSEFVPLPSPDLRHVKRKNHSKLLLEWSRQNILLQRRYNREKGAFFRDHREAFSILESSAFQRKVLERLRREIHNKTVNGRLLIAERLNWVVLPPGIDGLGYLRQHCEQIAHRHPGLEIDFHRIERVYELGPQATYTGLNEFDGYLVFYFAQNRTAVLECPMIGNALYLVRGDWMALSRLTKTELLRRHSGRVSRVIHTDGWIYHLKRYLSVRAS